MSLRLSLRKELKEATRAVRASETQADTCSGTDGDRGDWDAGEIIPGLFVGSLSAARDVVSLRSHGITHVLTAAGRLKVWLNGDEGVQKSAQAQVSNHIPQGIDWLQLALADHPAADLLAELPTCMGFFPLPVQDDPASAAPARRRLRRRRRNKKKKPKRKRKGKKVKRTKKLMSLLGDGQSGTGTGTPRMLVHCASGVSRSVSICVAFLMLRQGMMFEDALALVRLARPNGMPNAGFRQQLIFLQNALVDSTQRIDTAVTRAGRSYQAWLADKGDDGGGGQGGILQVVRKQRECANELHLRVDRAEESIKSFEAEDNQANASNLRDELEAVLAEVAELDTAVGGHALTDRPASMIRRSARSKAMRLIKDLDQI